MVQSLPSLQIPRLPTNFEEPLNQRNFKFRLERNLLPFNSVGYEQLVQGLMIQQSDSAIDSVVLKLHNPNNRLISDRWFETKQVISIFLGYETQPLVFHGDYVMHNPEYHISDESFLIVRGFNALTRLTQEEKRRQFLGRTHSEIVQQIAFENKILTTDIQATTTKYEKILQANSTDYQLIRDLAEQNGFLFFMEDNILTFRKMNLLHVGFFIDYKKGQGMVREAKVTILSQGKNTFFVSTHVNPLDGSLVANVGAPRVDAVTDIEGPFLTPASQISTNKIRFLVGQHHKGMITETQQIVDAATSSSRYIVKMEITVIGNQNLKARRLVAIRGLARFNGVYYVKKCTHTWDATAGYLTSMECYRTYTGNFIDNQPGIENTPIPAKDVTSKSKIIGTFEVG